MSASPLSPDDFRAAAEVHRELGPDYSEAVVESFFAKIDNEIGARIDARLSQTSRAEAPESRPAAAPKPRSFSTGVAVGLVAGAAGAGIPLSWLTMRMANYGGFDGWYGELQLTWVVIALVIAVVAGRRVLARAARSLAETAVTKLAEAQPDKPTGLPARPSTR